MIGDNPEGGQNVNTHAAPQLSLPYHEHATYRLLDWALWKRDHIRNTTHELTDGTHSLEYAAQLHAFGRVDHDALAVGQAAGAVIFKTTWITAAIRGVAQVQPVC